MYFTTSLTHRVNPRDCLIMFLVHEKIKQMRILADIVFLTISLNKLDLIYVRYVDELAD